MHHKLHRFVHEQRGTVGLLLALAAIPMFALAGGVIDYAYVQDERSRLQNAMDAAVLAALREGVDGNEFQATVEKYLSANYKPGPRVRFDPADLQIIASQDGDTYRVTATITVSVHMPFWSLVGVNTYNLRVLSEAVHGATGLEVVLVLDNTLSMSWDDYSPRLDAVLNKMEELKSAARQLVNDLHDTASNSNTRIHVGIVPYSVYVRLDPEQYGDAPWLDMTFFNKNAPEDEQWEGYVGFRSPPRDLMDGEYDLEGIPAVPRLWFKDGYVGSLDGREPFRLGTMVPLSDVSDSAALSKLEETIDGMYANGWTYIPAGLVWGWRMLTAQEPLDEALSQDEARAQNVKKVIILMTDGVNTCRHEEGTLIECREEWEDGSPDGAQRTMELCDRIKQEGIKIITIAYAVNDANIRSLMRSCSNAGYYEPWVGDLENVFDDIARKITRLYLSR